MRKTSQLRHRSGLGAGRGRNTALAEQVKGEFMSAIQTIKHRLGLLSTDEFAAQNPEEIPMPERSEYPTNDEGIPKVPPEDVLGVFPTQSAWGNRIKFRDFQNRTVTGWITPRVEDGDLFGYQMQSGRIAVFRLVNVDNQRNPSDMFFADAIDIGILNTDTEGDAFENLGKDTRFFMAGVLR